MISCCKIFSSLASFRPEVCPRTVLHLYVDLQVGILNLSKRAVPPADPGTWTYTQLLFVIAQSAENVALCDVSMDDVV